MKEETTLFPVDLKPMICFITSNSSFIHSLTGLLNRVELRDAMEAVTGSKFSMSHIETLWAEFDKDQDGTIDYPEFQKMMGYVKAPRGDSMRRSVSTNGTEQWSHLHSLRSDACTISF